MPYWVNSDPTMYKMVKRRPTLTHQSLLSGIQSYVAYSVYLCYTSIHWMYYNSHTWFQWMESIWLHTCNSVTWLNVISGVDHCAAAPMLTQMLCRLSNRWSGHVIKSHVLMNWIYFSDPNWGGSSCSSKNTYTPGLHRCLVGHPVWGDNGIRPCDQVTYLNELNLF